MEESERIPIVRARRVVGSETDLLIVDECPWCGGSHVHGAGGASVPMGFGDGHRVADCGKGSYDVRELRRPRRVPVGRRKAAA